MDLHKADTGVFALISDGDFSSIDFHPADVPDLDWDDSFDPNPSPCNEPEIISAELDDDSWWYSDAYTPDSKYEEWFLTNSSWHKKSRSRRYRGPFNPKKKHAIDSNELENHQNARDRCGDDDADDFRSLNSGSEPSQISSAASSVKSFNSLSREMSEDEEITPTDSNQLLKIPPFPKESYASDIQYVQDEKDNSKSNTNENILDTNGGDFMERETDNFVTPDPDFGHESCLPSQGQDRADYSVEKVSDYDRTQFFVANGANNVDIQKSDNSFMFPSANPFQYRESNESLHSSVLGPFRKQTLDGNVTGADIINRLQLSSRGSISLKPCENSSIQLSPLNSGKLSFFSSTARVALSQENRYDHITYDVSTSLLPENKCDLETASEEVLNLGQVISEYNPETSPENVGIPRMSTSTDQIPFKPTKHRSKSLTLTKPNPGHGKIREDQPVLLVAEKRREKKRSNSVRIRRHVHNHQKNSLNISKSELSNIISNTAQVILNYNRSVQDSPVPSEVILNPEEEQFLENLSITNENQIECEKDTTSDDLIFFTPRIEPTNRPISGIPVFRSAIPVQPVQKQIRDPVVLQQEKLSVIPNKSRIPTPKPSPRKIKPAPKSIPKIKPRTRTVPTPPTFPRKRFGRKPPEDFIDDITDLPVKASGRDPTGYLQIHIDDFPKIGGMMTSKSNQK